MSESNLENKNLFSAVNLVEDLDNKAAETISGGYEVFEIKNTLDFDVNFTLDGYSQTQTSGETLIWTAYSGGGIKFDTDSRAGYKQYKSYNLADGGTYEFQSNNYTRGNPYDIDIYDVG